MDSEEFKKLEGEYKFLSHAREHLLGAHTELERDPFTIVDLETTGLDPLQNEIIEIGAIKAEGGEIKDIFNKLVKPKSAISSLITEITGITNEMVENSPSIEEVLPEFLSFIGKSDLIAHNADFDIPFLSENVKRSLKRDLTNMTMCTLKIARALLPGLENHKLHTVAHYFKVPISARHRAIGDCEATYQVWIAMVKKLKERNVNTKDELEAFIKVNTPVGAPF